MLRFFRRIRQKFWGLDELKGASDHSESLRRRFLGRYLSYGAGEILLVMIGILLALQVNNWNEQRKAAQLEQSYLILLKEEFSFNLEALDQVMSWNQNFGDKAFEILQLTGPNEPQITEEEFEKLLFETINTEVQYRPRTGVLDEIINSGKLGIFSDQSLRISLSSWDGILFMVRFQEQEIAFFRQGLSNLLDLKGNARSAIFNAYGGIFDITPSKFKKSNLGLLQSINFENQLTGFLMTSRYANQNYYPILKVEIEKILELIDSQLLITEGE